MSPVRQLNPTMDLLADHAKSIRHLRRNVRLLWFVTGVQALTISGLAYLVAT